MNKTIQMTWCPFILASMLGCVTKQTATGEAPVIEDLGTLHFALEPGPSDVAGVIVVVEGEGIEIREYVSILESMRLPEGILDNAGSDHVFTDVYFTLPPGPYEVTVYPMQRPDNVSCVEATEECMLTWSLSELCAPARVIAEVIEGLTTEVLVMSRCDMTDNGGLDVIVTFNFTPEIVDFAFDPSKFVSTCDALELTVTARDRDRDPLTYTWEIVTAPLGAIYSFEPHGRRARLTSATAGDYEVRVVVCDTVPAPGRQCADLVAPIHVVTDPTRDACNETTVIWAQNEDFARGTESNVVYSHDRVVIDHFECRETDYLWVPSTAEDHMVLFDIHTRAVLGKYPTCDNPSRIGQDHQSNVYVSCREDGRVMKMDLDGRVHWDTDLNEPCGEALRGAVYVPRAGEPDRVYVGCSSKPGTFVLDANDGAVIDRIETHEVYGLATDGLRIYVAPIFAPIQAIDLETQEVIWTDDSGMIPYGIAATLNGGVWISGNHYRGAASQACHFDGATGRRLGCVGYDPEGIGRGVAVSPVDGSVWVALSHTDRVVKIDPETLTAVGQYPSGGLEPVGVSVSSEGIIYVVHERTSTIGRLTSEGRWLESFGGEALSHPYAYSSDMTGSVARCLEAVGVWRSEPIDMGQVDARVLSIEWDAVTPEATEVEVQYRLDHGPWIDVSLEAPRADRGQIIEIKVTLHSVGRAAAPALNMLLLTYASNRNAENCLDPFGCR